MGSLVSRLGDNFRDLTHSRQMETNSVPFLNLISVDDDLAMRYSPDRMQFYANLWEALNGPDPTVVDKVLGIELKNRNQYDTTLEQKKKLVDSLTNLKTEGGAIGESWFSKKLNELKGVKPDAAAPGVAAGVAAAPLDKGKQKDIYDEWTRDPIYSPEAEAVATTDRVVFIAVTYAFRAITLYLIEWSIHNRMITSFETAFWYYFFIYMSFFILLVMLVNIKTESPLFRMMFYYVCTDVKGGTLRVFVHSVVQFLLIIIPFILRETSASSSQTAVFLSFEERQNILKTLSRFTLFTWILTSAVALRV
jgi:hypothetical protein